MPGRSLGKGLPGLERQGLLDKVAEGCKVLPMMLLPVSDVARCGGHSEEPSKGHPCTRICERETMRVCVNCDSNT